MRRGGSWVTAGLQDEPSKTPKGEHPRDRTSRDRGPRACRASLHDAGPSHHRGRGVGRRAGPPCSCSMARQQSVYVVSRPSIYRRHGCAASPWIGPAMASRRAGRAAPSATSFRTCGGRGWARHRPLRGRRWLRWWTTCPGRRGDAPRPRDPCFADVSAAPFDAQGLDWLDGQTEGNVLEFQAAIAGEDASRGCSWTSAMRCSSG